MMDSSDIQIHKWAAQKIDVDVDRIDRVWIDMNNGEEHCSTCGPDAPTISVYIYRVGAISGACIEYYDDPTALIREICAA